MTVRILHGDALEQLRTLADESVHSVVTDPPYSLGFMGKHWDSHDGAEDAAFGYYLSGLVDGEGHFRVQEQARGTYSCAFRLKLRRDDRAILVRAQRFLGGVGSITDVEGSGNAHPLSQLTVQNKSDCLRIVDVFSRYPLRAKKLHDFVHWAEAVLEWNEMRRGHRWSGKGDWSRLAALKESIEAVREYHDPPWSGNAFQDWTREWAEQCLRVLKPGGHLLSFGGSRTYHRMACAIEDAGFEIRDQIFWCYGSGFPKSLNVSKQIDKHGGKEVAWFGPWFRQWREEKRISQKEVAALFPSKTGGLTGCVANWELGFNLPTCEQFNAIRDAYGLPFESLDAAEREIIGKAPWATLNTGPLPGADCSKENRSVKDITAPATESARQWQGWGTALKPAHEPIVVARKPLIGTVAANVLKHGTGALNIDGCRVGDSGAARKITTEAREDSAGTYGHGLNGGGGERDLPFGRWPANLIHDGSDEVLAGFPQASGQSGSVTGNEPSSKTNAIYGAFNGRPPSDPRGDTGSAARFFYTAKASRDDRNIGLQCSCNNQAWANVDREAAIPLATDTQRPRATTESTTADDSEWPTSLRGNGLMGDLFPLDSKSITETKTSKTTILPTSISLTPSPTSAFTPAANSAAESGGSLAASAANESQSAPSIGISAGKAGLSTDDADPVTSESSFTRSASAGYCPSCGRLNRSTHPTVKPTDLMQYLVRLVTPPGGTVLDPFAGSGSTGLAADREGFDAILIERDAEYVEIARRRIVGDCPLFTEIAA